MSWQSWQVGNDLRRQIRHSSNQGHKAGRNFVRQNRRKDKVWFSSALDEIETKVSGLELPRAVEALWHDAEKGLDENPVSKSVEGLQRAVDPSAWLTDFLKGNLPKACLRASISCAVFHEVKERIVKPVGARAAVRVAERGGPKYKSIEPATAYVCDIMLPTPLYGPFFLFLMGKARDWVVGTSLSATGLKGED